MLRYFTDFWKVINMLSYVLFVFASIIHDYQADEMFTVSRRLYSLSLIVMYLRFLEVFRIHQKIGPTLVMIREMVILIIWISLYQNDSWLYQSLYKHIDETKYRRYKRTNYNTLVLLFFLGKRPVSIHAFNFICCAGSWNILSRQSVARPSDIF